MPENYNDINIINAVVHALNAKSVVSVYAIACCQCPCTS